MRSTPRGAIWWTPNRASFLLLAALAAAGCAKRPAASFEVVQPPPPRIESVTHGAPEGARPGDTVSITMKGDAGLKASASVKGLVQAVPMSEDPGEQGLYRGSLIVPGASPGSYELAGRLEAAPDLASTLGGPALRVLSPPPPPPPPRRTDTAADFNAQKVLKPIYFDFDRHDLRADARETLASNAEWLKAHPSLRLLVEGHCDERGTNEYNLALGDRRANAARDWLVGAGIEAGRVRTISYGEERPSAPGRDETAWSRNRRAEFVLED